jgi:Ca2+-binding EF-hand superfamily protein
MKHVTQHLMFAALSFLVLSTVGATAAPLSDADCDAVWKLADVDKDGSINPEEAKSYVANFVQADVDKDGTIDYKEFKAACKAGLVKK